MLNAEDPVQEWAGGAGPPPNKQRQDTTGQEDACIALDTEASCLAAWGARRTSFQKEYRLGSIERNKLGNRAARDLSEHAM